MKIYKDNITDRNIEFEKLVVKTQKQMKEYVKGRLGNLGKVKHGDGYVFHKGTFPVLLCAHMDTVHKEVPETLVYANGTLSSTQGIGGDDRCGIYMIFKILEKYDCSVVFLEEEEIGCIGAKKFVKTKACKSLEGKLKYIIEFDRKGNNHAVTYDCENEEFDFFITKEFFKKEYGTCSDISYIAPALKVAAVNFSCGYYQEHHIEEWVNLKEMETIIVEAMKVLERTKEITEPFKYIEAVNYYGSYGRSYGRTYGRYNYYDDVYDDYGYNGNGYGSYSYMPKYEFTYKVGDVTYIKTVEAWYEDKAYYEFFKKNTKVCYADIIDVKKKN